MRWPPVSRPERRETSGVASAKKLKPSMATIARGTSLLSCVASRTTRPRRSSARSGYETACSALCHE
eukprot:393525-Rhodomonas_salina.2